MGLTLAVFLGELAVHSYRRFAAKEKISDETYKHLILTSALANGASAVGSSLGAGIGFFIGTLMKKQENQKDKLLYVKLMQ